jgi:hypothetical protein
MGHAGKVVPGFAAGIVLVLAASACSSGSSPSAGPAASGAAAAPAAVSTQSTGMSRVGAHSLPAQTARTLPAFPAYYDAHKDVVVVTDAFPKRAARAYHANFAPALSAVKPSSQPLWYIVRGRAVPGQLAVLGSEPGEDNYSPLWRTVIVRWKPGVSPRLLTSDDMINSLAMKGQLTATTTSMVVNSTVLSVKGSPVWSASAAGNALGAHSLPAQAKETVPAFPTYYDAHKDDVVVTDAFPKPAALIFHANFAPSLRVVKLSSQPLWYIVRGRAVPGQLAVLGSEPGENNYSPLWRTVIVRWKTGVSPRLLTSDDMINSLAKKGRLTITDTSMLVNAPVVSKP